MLFEANTPLHDVKRLAWHDSIRATERHYLACHQSRAVAAIDNLPNSLLVSPPVRLADVPQQSAAVPSWPDELPREGPQADALYRLRSE